MFMPNWEESPPASTVFSDVSLAFTSCNGVTNNPPTATVQLPTVTAASTGTQTASVFTGVSPGTGETATQTVNALCAPDRAGIVSSSGVSIVITGTTATISYAPNFLTVSDSTTVFCTFTDSLSSSITRSFTIVVPAGSGVGGGSGTGLPYSTFRIALRMKMQDFRASTFLAAVASLVPSSIPFGTPYINWVCPEPVCYSDPRNCFAQNPSCTAGTALLTSRVAADLEADDEVIYVDFDFATASQFSDTEMNSYMQSLAAIYNNELEDCWDGDDCAFKAQNPTNDVILIPSNNVATFSPHRNEDDDSMSTGLLILLIAGGVLACLLLLLLLYCCSKNNKGNGTGNTNNNERQMQQTKDPASYDDSYYSKSYGDSKRPDDDYSYYGEPEESYYDESYAPPAGPPLEQFFPDDRVRAHYLDGQWYDATILAQTPDGKYDVEWYDGTHSGGIPPDQLQRP
ncbi:hypothetical protein DIPPA_18537 [Diplonema papillatum]|nr:hypothetical protein DIPPA_18537 [Diplonema papillatum]